MAIAPDRINGIKTNASENVINAIRNSGTEDMKNKLPEVTGGDTQSLREFGKVMMDYAPIMNFVAESLINQIAFTVLHSQTYYNHLSMFKQGFVELGEVIEEIYVGLIDPEEYNLERGEKELFKHKFPDIKTAFHIANYHVFYKVTILEEALRRAFTSWSALNSLIESIIGRIYTSAQYDEENATKYLLACGLIDGTIKSVQAPEIAKGGDLDEVVIQYRKASNDFTFMDTAFNYAGVETFTSKEDQRLIIDTEAEARLGVKVLATAFNMTEVEYPTRRVLINSLSKIDFDRLRECFSDDPSIIREFTDEQKAELEKVHIILLDQKLIQIYDNLDQMRAIENPQTMGWNRFFHQWKTFALSPFVNAQAYSDTKPEIVSVTVSPTALTTSVGIPVQLGVTVETKGFADKNVTWTSSDDEIATVNVSGNVTPFKAGEVTMTATSVVDPTKSATATVTIAEVTP